MHRLATPNKPSPSRGHSDRSIYKRLLIEAKPYWLAMAGYFLLSLLEIPLALLLPLPIKIEVDSVLGSHPLPSFLTPLIPAGSERSITFLLIFPAVLLIAIALLAQLQALTTMVLYTYIGEKLVLRFRAKLFLHMERLSLSYHDRRSSSESVYRLQNDANALSSVVLDGLVPFTTAAFTVIAILYVTARIDWQLVLIAIGVSLVLMSATYWYAGRLRESWHRAKEMDSSAMALVQEVLGSLRVVKAFGGEAREQERFVLQSGKGAWLRIAVSYRAGIFKLIVGLTIAAGMALALFFGGLHVRSNRITIGDLVMVMAYLAQLYIPLSMTTNKIGALQTALAGIERAFSVLGELAEVTERPNARPLSRAEGSVIFRHVSFAHRDDHPVLKYVSFEVPAGSSVGIVGKTGAGKTTLVSLLSRFYDPTEGHVLLDGVDIREYKLTDLRSQFGLVPQDPVLFSRTIADNIAYASADAGENDIVEAAKAANAHDFIMKLPEGYQTVVGERGATLSGGERQRVALARAFLKNAPILILDEPTSSIDLKTEASIMEATQRLIRGRTSFIIAHRFSTLENCDILLTIEHGKVVTVFRRHPNSNRLC
jgi:ATP-binding cassette, subfamily B, bacterial